MRGSHGDERCPHIPICLLFFSPSISCHLPTAPSWHVGHRNRKNMRKVIGWDSTLSAYNKLSAGPTYMWKTCMWDDQSDLNMNLEWTSIAGVLHKLPCVLWPHWWPIFYSLISVNVAENSKYNLNFPLTTGNIRISKKNLPYFISPPILGISTQYFIVSMSHTQLNVKTNFITPLKNEWIISWLVI